MPYGKKPVAYSRAIPRLVDALPSAVMSALGEGSKEVVKARHKRAGTPYIEFKREVTHVIGTLLLEIELYGINTHEADANELRALLKEIHGGAYVC